MQARCPVPNTPAKVSRNAAAAPADHFRNCLKWWPRGMKTKRRTGAHLCRASSRTRAVHPVPCQGARTAAGPGNRPGCRTTPHGGGHAIRDPVIVRFLAEHRPFQRFLERLYAALIGDDTGPETLVQAAMLSGAIGSAEGADQSQRPSARRSSPGCEVGSRSRSSHETGRSRSLGRAVLTVVSSRFA